MDERDAEFKGGKRDLYVPLKLLRIEYFITYCTPVPQQPQEEQQRTEDARNKKNCKHLDIDGCRRPPVE